MEKKDFFDSVDFIKSDDKMLEEYGGVLYHYTTVEGLLGIINTNVIFATSYPFLNDSSEIVYGRRIFKNIINEKLDKNCDMKTKLLYNECLRLIDQNNFRIYITCFCEKGNLLSQWRGYAKNGLGFSLGLSAKSLLSTYREAPYNLIKIKKVEYNVCKQKKIINKLLDKAEEYIKTENIEKEKEIKKIAKIVNKKIEEFIVFFKDPAFQEEREWRAIYYEKDEELIKTKYRAKSDRIVDYKEFVLNPYYEKKYNKKLPICEIICGPGIDNPATIEVIKKLLKDNDYKRKVNIKNSTIPFKIV